MVAVSLPLFPRQDQLKLGLSPILFHCRYQRIGFFKVFCIEESTPAKPTANGLQD